jgi:hypothetical protein
MATLSTAAFAGGGGENMLLVVNPNDEASLRIANAYATLRDIPDSNILFIAPNTRAGYPVFDSITTSFAPTYMTPISDALTARGIDGQIDYIATIGQPQTIAGTYKAANGTSVSVKESLNYALSMMTQLQRGMPFGSADSGPPYYTTSDAGAAWRRSELLQNAPPASGTWSYVTGSNAAIHHSTQYTIPAGVTKPPGYNYAQWYMSGNVGNAGMFALTPQQIINNLAYTVAADGTKPAGRIYFEDNGDVLRSGTRKVYWPSVQAYMTAHNIQWVQETNVNGSTPLNRNDVRGAVIGAATPKYPNGSVYLPGSYVDDLTSNAGGYASNSQVKQDKTLLTGAGATAGSITEPYAVQDRFTYASVFVFSNDGSTLGEAHYKAVNRPDIDMFEGDMLSQAYADVPKVTLNSAPANYATVSGAITINASAALVAPITTTATGIARLDLFVDGLKRATVNAASGDLGLDTTQLSDGVHQVRVVAYNNSAAEVQGYTLSNITVNNKGESVASSVGGAGPLQAYWNENLSIPTSAVTGTGTVTSIQLQSLGRVVGSVNGASGNISLDAKTLAYGDNRIVPVALFADGSKVAGQPFTVTRDFHRLAGAPVVAPVANRTPGFRYEYFGNTAGNTIATTSYSGTPNYTNPGTVLIIDPDSTTPENVNMPDEYKYTGGNGNKGLAIRGSSEMLVTTPGEYSFWFTSQGAKWDSLQFSIDGTTVISHEFWNGTKFDNQAMPNFGVDTTATIYLEAGQHDLQLLLATAEGTGSDSTALANFWYRGPDGVSVQPSTAAAQSSGASFYTAPRVCSTWATNTSGDWATPANWVGTSVPSGAGAIARFGGNTAAAINLASSQTVGRIDFSGTTNYTIGSNNGSTLTFDNTGGASPGNASITSARGNHTISARVITTASNLDLAVAAGSVTLSNGIGGTGNVNLTGPGTVILRGTTDTTGPLTVHAGKLGGYGTITGAVVAGTGAHTIAPSAGLTGPTSGTMTAGSLTTNGNTTLSFNLVTPGVSDLINVTGANALVVGPGTRIDVASTPTGAGSLGYYKILQFVGAAPSLADFVLPATANGIAYTLDSTINPGFITLHRGFLGDANDDGSVNFADFVQMSNHYGEANAGWAGGDLNGDGVTSFADFVVLSNNYGQTVGASSFSADAAFGAATGVPEPATLGVLALGAMGLLGRRRAQGK